MSNTPLLRPALPGPSHLPRRIFIGSIVTPVSLTHLRLIERGVLGVGTSGVIRFVEDLAAAEAAASTAETQDGDEAARGRADERAATTADREATPVAVPGATGLSNVDPLAALPPPALPPSRGTSASALTQAMRREELAITSVVERNGWKLSDCEVVRMDSGSFLCPGFIDTHTHACQVPNIGLGQQYELLDWLQHITFPRERRFEDPRYARKTYESVVQRMIDSGTTCAAIYATIHEEATKILAEICNERGMRALVGKCQMDRNSPIDYIEKNASVSMEATKEFIRYTRSLRPYGETPNVKSPVLSPSGGSSGSPEMDASIARLSATMSEIMESESRKNGGGGGGGGGEAAASSSNSSSLEALPPAAAEMSPDAAATAGAATPTPLSQSMSLTASQTTATEAAHARRSAQLARYASQRHSSTSSVHSGTGSRSRTRSGTGGAQSPRDTKRTNDHLALVQPILTPRFAISCSDSMLASIAALLSRDPSLRVQTHLSENEGEIAFTRKLFPFASSYTAVYDHFSLLGQRTILAHAIHLDEEEMTLIHKRGCGISHCPTSNFNLRSGTSRVGEMLNRGIKVGLGTDASGGFGLGMLSAIREASVVAKVLNFPAHNSQLGGPSVAAATSVAPSAPLSTDEGRKETKETDRLVDGRGTLPPADARFRPRRPPAMQSSGSSSVPTTPADEKDEVQAAQTTPVNPPKHDFCEGPLSIATLFYLATQGGADVCSLGDTVGSLEPGKEFDALLIRTTSDWDPVKGYTGCPGMYCEVEDGIEERIEKFLFCGDDRNIGSVFIRGRVVGGADPIS